MFFFGKILTNVTIKTDKMICSATVFPKTALLGANKTSDSKAHFNQLFTVFSAILHEQLVKAIGQQLTGSEGSLPGFGTETVLASLREDRNILNSQMNFEEKR